MIVNLFSTVEFVEPVWEIPSGLCPAVTVIMFGVEWHPCLMDYRRLYLLEASNA